MARRVPSAGEFKNFGGINQASTKLNLKSPFAEDIENFDIDSSGAITSRLDLEALSMFSGTPQYATAWLSIDKTQYYAVIAGNTYYEATSLAGPWTDRTGGVALTESTRPWSSVVWRGVLYLVNGTDAPIMAEPGQDLVTLKDASILTAPQNLTVTKVGTLTALTGTYYWLVVEAVTGRGSTGASAAPTRIAYNVALIDGSNYLTLDWDEVPAASVIRVWLARSRTASAGTTHSYYNLLTELPGSATTFTIQSITGISNGYTFSEINTAYNTPEDWETNGYPALVSVVSRGRDERMAMVRKNLVWMSALADPLDWYTPGNAFGLTMNGGTSDMIEAVSNIYDYYTFFSSTDAFLWRGASQETMNQAKIVPVGCSSPQSVVYADGDVWMWTTESGPAALRRVTDGADVEIVKQFTAPVKDLLKDLNVDKLNQIVGVYDASGRRIIWYYPSSGSSVNDLALVYQLDTRSFSRYSGTDIKCAFTTQGYIPLGLSATGDFGTINTGDVAYDCTYKSAWFDTGGWDNKKRIQYLDIAVDSTEDYEVAVTYAWDYGSGPSESITIAKVGSSVTTNGMVVDASRKGPKVNIHRVFTRGQGSAWQLTLATVGYVKILGWKPEYLVMGGRN